MVEPLKKLKRESPEAKIQENVITYLKRRDWFVMPTHGNLYQRGFPDLYCTHYVHGIRWIEVKLPEMKGSHFTNAQMEIFPKLIAHGTRIWVLTAATDVEYAKLFKQMNLWYYMMRKM